MSRWNIKAPALIVLSCVVLVMLVIVVLPDVDLLDTAFHRGTAPLVIHARATGTPAFIAIATLFQSPRTVSFRRPDRDLDVVAANLDPNFRPILLRSIRR